MRVDFEDESGFDCGVADFLAYVGVDMPSDWSVTNVATTIPGVPTLPPDASSLTAALTTGPPFGPGCSAASVNQYDAYFFRNTALFCENPTSFDFTITFSPGSAPSFPGFNLVVSTYAGGATFFPTAQDCPDNNIVDRLSLQGGTIAANQAICAGSDPAAFTSTAAASNGTAPYAYQWQSGPSSTGPWTDITGATAQTYDPGVIAAAGTTYYRRRVRDAAAPVAEAFSNVLSITTTAVPTANAGPDQSGATAVCGTTATLAPTPAGGSWSVVSQPMGASASLSGNTAGNLTLPGTYTFRYTVVGTGGCPNATD
ncbi:MAG: hypothetical protein LW884_03880, partial [Bacteroidetes bacterium]|nr:hypothetical protein [Bacteroidota bacterium]